MESIWIFMEQCTWMATATLRSIWSGLCARSSDRRLSLAPASISTATFPKNWIDELDVMTAYRTAPHVDGDQTRERAVRLLLDAIRSGRRPCIAHLNVPILIPGEKGITSVEPLRSLYGQLPGIGQKEGLLDASIFAGMPWTDVVSSRDERAGGRPRHLASGPGA